MYYSRRRRNVRKTKDAAQYPVVAELASLKSQMSDKQVTFAGDLVNNYNRYGQLSIKQMECVRNLIENIKNPPQRTAPDAIKIDVTGIRALFDAALEKLKRPKVAIQTDTGQSVRFAVAGPNSRYANSIMVSNGDSYGSSIFYGSITGDLYQPTQYATPEVIDLIKEFAQDPAGVAAKYGHLTGGCSFCSKGLTDDRSTQVGYGPVCAKNWKLPWG